VANTIEELIGPACRRGDHRLGGPRDRPTFFIDGERYGGFYDVESLTWALEDAVAASR